MISIVCWLWNDDTAPANQMDRKREFLPEHVNTLRRMLKRHMSMPFKLVCVADESAGLDPKVEFLKTPDEARALSELRSPEGMRFPSCYRRLWAFSAEAKVLGERCLFTDIDIVIMNDLAPLFENKADFVGWRPLRDWGAKLRFGGGTYLLTPGTRTFVWDDFAGQESIDRARSAGFRGSDQAWLSYCLAEREIYWPMRSGVYSVRDLKYDRIDPTTAMIMHFNGHVKPWQSDFTWAKQHWR